MSSLNTLLKYRFTKKNVPKLSPTQSSNESVSNGYDKDSGDAQSIPDSPIIITNESSNDSESQNINGQSTQESIPLSPSPGPWLSKNTSQPTQKAETNGVKYRRIKRPISESDEDDNDTSSTGPLSISEQYLKKLKEMFPTVTDNRIRAALIVKSNNFNSAVEFLSADKSNKRKEPSEEKKDYKRIKILPESPTSPRVVGLEFLQESTKETKALDFLIGCFPSKNVEELKSALAANDNDAELTAAQLTSEMGGVDQSGDAGPSATTHKPEETNNTLTSNKESKKQKNGKKEKVRRKVIDFSDEEEEYEEFDDSGDSDDSENEFHNKSKSETDNFLQFFEEATIEELNALPGCSKKKAEIIMSLRPFTTWDNLYAKFNSEKLLSTNLISGCKEVMQIRNAIRRLMVRCEGISEQMGQVVARLTGAQTSLSDKKKIAKQPEVLNKEFTLQPYQLIGLSWLSLMHEQELNGILADEMGLGKTIQAISFIAHLMEHGEEGPHVVIVPSSTIENWLREMQKWCPSIKVIVYYGSQEERRAVRHSIFFQQEEFNVLLTTYNMATGGVEDRVLFKKFAFHYAIFDEGHMLKNMSSNRYQNLMKISAERRLLLTGTPLQNNLLELMSLLCFVMPEIFQGKTDQLKRVFSMMTKNEENKKSRFEKDRIAQAKRIMKPFVLRRLKKDVLGQLPPKTDRIERLCMIPSQQELYDGLLAQYSQEFSEESKSGGVGIFMQFRKAANHPLLIRNHYNDDKLNKMAKKLAKEPSHRDRGALPELIQEDMAVMNDFDLRNLCIQYKKWLGEFILDESVIGESGKFRVLDRLLPEMKEQNDRVLLFSQFTMMLDIMEVYLEQKGYKYLRLDGQTPVPDRLQLIDKFNNNPDIFIFLLSTRAGGLGINLTAANTIILHDIDFNPYNDKQAEDRCHRLGQTREVHVVKLISEDTVDEMILRCANAKLALERDIHGPSNDDSEEKKDVASLLKEVLKKAQQKKSEASQNGHVPKSISIS